MRKLRRGNKRSRDITQKRRSRRRRIGARPAARRRHVHAHLRRARHDPRHSPHGAGAARRFRRRSHPHRGARPRGSAHPHRGARPRGSAARACHVRRLVTVVILRLFTHARTHDARMHACTRTHASHTQKPVSHRRAKSARSHARTQHAGTHGRTRARIPTWTQPQSQARASSQGRVGIVARTHACTQAHLHTHLQHPPVCLATVKGLCFL